MRLEACDAYLVMGCEPFKRSERHIHHAQNSKFFHFMQKRNLFSEFLPAMLIRCENLLLKSVYNIDRIWFEHLISWNVNNESYQGGTCKPACADIMLYTFPALCVAWPRFRNKGWGRTIELSSRYWKRRPFSYVVWTCYLQPQSISAEYLCASESTMLSQHHNGHPMLFLTKHVTTG